MTAAPWNYSSKNLNLLYSQIQITNCIWKKGIVSILLNAGNVKKSVTRFSKRDKILAKILTDLPTKLHHQIFGLFRTIYVIDVCVNC